MRTTKTILRKVNELKGNANMSPAVYRLFTYIPWEDIPQEYIGFFPATAKEEWNKDLKDFDEKYIRLDLDAEIKAVFKGLFKRNITQSLSILPIILADVYMLNKPINALQAEYTKVVLTFMEFASVDRELAEQLAAAQLAELLEKITKTANIKLGFHIPAMLTKILEEHKSKAKDLVQPDIEALVDKALKEYDEKTNIQA